MVDVTEEIIGILGKFPGDTLTYVNTKAFSAGAFISIGTKKIYMAPGSVIGAAAPIMMSPGGTGVEKMPETMELKITSGISALMRACAEKNGYNKDVIEAMIDKNKELTVDGVVLNEKGRILTLTNTEAERKYGNPAMPLLSSGTFASLDELLEHLGAGKAEQIKILPLGAETIARWINSISPILLIIGMLGLYIEFKTPGFGLPGIVGISAFALYFLGGYVAGLAGLEWAALFIVGLIMVLLELLFFTGTLILGLAGAFLMLLSLIMGTVDFYPGSPAIPSMPELQLPLRSLALAMLGTVIGIFALIKLLPHTSLYGHMVSTSVSAEASDTEAEQKKNSQLGWVGVAMSPLRPGGKARFEDAVLDVVTQGDMIEPGTRVRIIGHSGTEALVERAESDPDTGNA
jgi:membrane-bound serine protease (ClpP class)